MPNWENRTLFHGDNLRFLRAMNSESVRLIATDPPFNKGRDFHATPDSLSSGASFQDRWSWDKDVHEEWVDQITDDFPKVMNVILGSRSSYGDDMGAFLCFMAVRLLEMHRVLRKDGSIYLHCDPTASHYLKELMDSIFGIKNFRNEIVWGYKGPSNTKRWFPKKHDIILFFVKSDDAAIFNRDAVRVPYSESFNTRRKYTEGDSGITAGYSDGRSQAEIKESFGEGKMIEDWWADIPGGGQISRHELTGYPTQKPLALYERIIKASSNKGDVVLDPFCGCATTCIAAERLGRQWVGIDIWDKAEETVLDRLERENMITSKSSKVVREPQQGYIFPKDFEFHFLSNPPKRTDGGEEAVPFLMTKKRIDEPKDEYLSNASKRQYLLEQYGSKCQGCDRVFDDPRYLELDHNTPRSDGGWNHIKNRILLCGPCNKLKSNKYTLSGLRAKNKKLGYITN